MPPPAPNKSAIYEFRLHFVLGPHGWGETYKFGSLAGTPQAAIASCVDLCKLRVGFLSDQAVLDSATVAPVSIWDNTIVPPAARPLGNVKVTDQGPFQVPGGLGAFRGGAIAGLPPDPNTALDLRLSAGNGIYNRTFQFRGTPMGQLKFSNEDGDVTPLVGGAAAAAMTAFSKRLIGTNPDPTGAYVLRGRSRDPLVTLDNDIQSAAPDGTGCYTALTLAKVIPYADGDLVHVHGVNGCVVKGLNGDARVMSVGPSNLLTLNKRGCCCLPFAVRPGGVVKKVVFNYYNIANLLGSGGLTPFPTRLRKRKTGKERAAPKGKRRPKCR